MSLTREPFHDLVRLQERMNRLFEQALSRGSTQDEELQRGAWNPPVDIQETADRIILRADLPGVELDRIELKVQDDHLTLKGERPADSNTRTGEFHRVERPSGSFYRSFTLPKTIDREGIQAKLKQGVLEVTLPKKTESRSKEIRVEVR